MKFELKKTFIFCGILILVIFVLTPTVSAIQYYGCTYHAYQQCSGNSLYWYDSCGNQQDLLQYCQNGCYNNACQNSYNNYNNYYYGYGNCTYHAYKLCIGNSIYWYSGCDQQQELFYACPSNQYCQYGQCVNSINQNTGSYQPYYRTECSGTSIKWYDSFGVVSGIYKNCNDGNSCTIDSCSANSCINTLKCDGTTCIVNSADYTKHCQADTKPITPPATQNNCGNGSCDQKDGETQTSCPQDCKVNTGVTASFFSKQGLEANQWQKTAQTGSNGQIYFMISVSNTSSAQVESIKISANIPSEISSLGNLQINGVPFSGDIVSGIEIGPISSQNTKLITFEGKTQEIKENSSKQAVINVNVSGSTISDSVSLNFSPEQSQTAAVTKTQTASGFSEFLKKWYMWIIVGVILGSLFVIMYKRLSSNV